MTTEETLSSAPVDFIRAIVAEDLKNGKNDGKVVTRFPPEPNGYLHIGHAKAICLDFGIAAENNGITHLRMDDTNPAKEDIEYVESIKNDVRWLGFDWKDKLFFASDYYEQFYNYAIALIKLGKAFVCDLSADEIRAYRGTLTEAGKESPYRSRSIAENLDLFTRMRSGEFPDGARTLRAKIDMASPNMHMRDPAIYRIRREHHYRTGDTWCIYPMYDFAHCLSDSIEGITHSICTLEFEIHRPLYDWFIVQLGLKSHPQQIEFARLNLTNTVMSKRKLLDLVKNNYVNGWDDPRMPTLCGMRRRGYTPEAIRTFVESTGVTKNNAVFDIALLEHYLRDDLNKRALRAMAVLDPLKVVITNFPEGEIDELDAINNPEDESAGLRKVSFTRELYIERDDFMEEPPKKFFRLAPGREVRLRYGYFIKCDEVVKDANGKIIELRCTCDPATRGGTSPDGRKVKGTIHWVSATQCANAEIRLYDHLFTVENPSESDLELKDLLNPDSLKIVEGKIERSLLAAKPGMLFQFERIGYFCCDPDSTSEDQVFNRSMTLKDSWSKIQKRENAK
ncbi:MAG: glutamine--tRNA ligase/YqeY domain fusion protein [Victivallaceae bacterium]|nr:glutamine--tRNA ligase/YqeY domain fusion protein [Victivallaceae bacterium]MDD4180114.1 glutamine--tRNA ligase/YqeY domain fusion protein [Victivallaceae bacterium]